MTLPDVVTRAEWLAAHAGGADLHFHDEYPVT